MTFFFAINIIHSTQVTLKMEDARSAETSLIFYTCRNQSGQSLYSRTVLFTGMDEKERL